jgi:hypothetical protein
VVVFLGANAGIQIKSSNTGDAVLHRPPPLGRGASERLLDVLANGVCVE